MVKKDGSMPKKGMNRDVHPSELSQEEYSFAVNANFQDEHGNGTIILQNEPSNIKCTGFKEGFKVIGHKFDINADKTYFFLVNPTTGCSEVGYIYSITNVSGLEQIEAQCDCNISVVLEDALENIIQENTCTYHTIINDCEGECSMCLGFSINFPIHEVNIHLKDELSGKVLYWTDNNKPQRHLKLDRITEEYLQTIDDCTGVVTPTCLQCEKMRIFPLFDKPCLSAKKIQNGGNLKAGVYEALVAYSSFEGDAISNYYSITNPIPIFDKNNNILDQTLLDYQTDQAISLELTDLDLTYEYYTIAIIYRNGLDGAPKYYVHGTYPIDTSKVTIATLRNKSTEVTLSDLLARRPHYVKAKGLSENNGHMFQYGLTTHREINLQPIVNLMGSLVKWNTMLANEDLYENGIFVSNYTGYMRDEVYPLSIKLYFLGGHETANFTFIARPPKANEIEVLNGIGSTFITNTATASILENAPICSGDLRDKRWQFENTATIEGQCVIETAGYSENEEVRELESTCDAGLVDTIVSGTLVIDTNYDLVTYINQNKENILLSVDPQWATIQAVLDDPSDYIETCVPTFDDNCSEVIVLVSEDIYIIDTATETESIVDADFADYERVSPPTICLNTLKDEFGDPVEDTTFMSVYMRPGEVVYKKITSPPNVTCSASQLISPYLGMSSSSIYMENKGALTSVTPLQTSLPVTLTTSEFSSFLHTNVIWFKLDFNGRDKAIVELSTINCNLIDDNTGSKIRVSLYDSCSAIIDEPSYGVIITDVTLANDPNKFIQLDAVDFPSGVAYIAVDSPIRSEQSYKIQLSGATGTAKITIDGIIYNFAFSGGLTATANTFVSTYAVAIKASHDITVTASAGAIYFRGATTYYTLTSITNLTGTLNGVKSSVQTYHTLTPPCGCFGIYDRTVETFTQFSFTNMTFGKRQTYKSECTFTVPTLGGCDPVPFEYGNFSYWESMLKYPCNGELYNSSDIKIKPSDLTTLSLTDQTAFEDYYVSGGSGAPALDADGNYILTGADFRDSPIRHFKFPDSSKVPFMSTSTQNPNAFKPSVIYPIGFKIDNDVINAFLDIAVNNGYLTFEERGNINKYEIFHGDRRTDKSIIAKGLLFDMYQYTDTITGEEAHYSNYPLNALGEDQFNEVNHPYSSTKNDKFTFHSPDIHFYKPTLPRELGIEGFQYGNSENYFDEVKDHSPYVILGDRAYNLATSLAIAESALETLLQVSTWLVDAGAGGVSTPIAIALASVAIASLLVTSLFKIGEYRYQWIQTLTNLGKPINFAYYQVSVGFYNYFKPNLVLADILRGIPSTTYLKSGKWSVPNEVTGTAIDINNTDREDSVFIGLGGASYGINYPLDYRTYDNSEVNVDTSSRRGYNGIGRSGKIVGNASSPYASLKQYLPEQYGSINTIDWVNTGYCGDLNSNIDCSTILGGDVYISRFAVKRKLPFFTTSAHGLAPNIPFAYSEYFNINPPAVTTDVDTIERFFINYKMNTDSDNTPVASFVFPSDRSHYNLDSGGNDINEFYVKTPNKFYLYSYGIPYFLVESVYNCNFRYAKRESHENFYPNIKDVIDWTQESNVSIKEPNTYFYNTVYSLAHSKSPWTVLPTNYEEALYKDLTNLDNTVIYSRQDVSESSITDPWLTYRAFDQYQFPTSYGKLVQMEGIESEQVIARFTNGFAIFGAIDLLADRLTPENKNVGSGGMFAGRNIAFNKTELGYAGTQHTTRIKSEFGVTWADAKRGKIFNLLPNAKGLEDLTEGMEKWFKENLPFKISTYYPTIDIDNTYKGVGISMGWDDRLKRVLITKLDYTPISDFICFNGTQFFSTDGYEDTIAEQELLGNTYLRIENCKLKFRNAENIDSFIDLDEIFVTNPDYFKDCSWTVAYSPLTKTWISYYSFKPNYYINYHNYFQTGLNYPDDMMEFGLWSHLSFLSSYQVFYGKLYPFTIEYPLSTKMTNSLLHNIEYWLDVRKYYNKYDFTDVYGIGFNKAVVYNNHQNSGYINLVTQEKNNLQQMMQYPKHNSDNIEVLQTELHGKWSFNYLYNLIRDEKAGLPIWIANCSQTEKTLDNRLLDYRSNFKDRLRGDYFLTRLSQDLESRYKLLFRFSVDNRDYYEQ